MSGAGIGLWVDPVTGQVHVAESLYVALEVICWLAAICAGLFTAKAVLP